MSENQSEDQPKKESESQLTQILLQKKQAWLKVREKTSRLEQEKWEKRVRELYNQIKEWLNPLQEEELLDFSEHSEAILNGDGEEEKVITYFAINFFNDKAIEFEPIGLKVDDVYGRVDMKLDSDKIMIVIKHKDSDWKLVRSNNPQNPPVYEEFDQKNFEQLVTEFVQYFDDQLEE
ncbi:hypothetical protein BGP_1632 [Beggiatoa sp. PS]|nr:hypothetical protein BGP_1632 [Beggiatoa sp. PS]